MLQSSTSTMKLAFAATFCLATVSAFGLQSPAKNAVQALRSKPLVGPKVSSSPMVEPIDINGDRMSVSLQVQLSPV